MFIVYSIIQTRQQRIFPDSWSLFQTFSEDGELWRHATLGHISPVIISLQFGVQSRHPFSIMTFRVVHFQPSVQSHHVLSIATFRVIFLSLTFIVISLVQHSKPLFSLGIHSYYFQFGIQSHHLFIVWRSQPWFQFGIQGHHIIFHLAFRATTSFQFGVQSRIFILAFDDTIFLQFGVQSR